MHTFILLLVLLLLLLLSLLLLLFYSLSLVSLIDYCCVSYMKYISLQEMCSLQCSLHRVIKEEQTRVVPDSRITQHGGSREFQIAQ